MNVNKANSKDIAWWNSLSLEWKATLIKNLIDDIDSDIDDQQIVDNFSNSNLRLLDILAIEKLSISYRLASDLTPVFKLDKLEDFYIIPPNDDRLGYSGVPDFIYIYPKQLRSKVKKLMFCMPIFFDGNFNSLEDFINLETIEFQACRINSLDGIEKLDKLKYAYLDQDNFYSDLSPLKGLKLKELDISFTEVFDLSPLANITTLEVLIMEGLTIDDLSPILKLPKLRIT